MQGTLEGMKARKPSKKLIELGERLNLRQRLFCQYYMMGFYEEVEVVAGPKKWKRNPFKKDDEDEEDEEPKTFMQCTRVRMGNATRSYAKAYERDMKKDEQTCWSESSKLLRNPKVQAYMAQILEENGFNNNAMDARLADIAFNGEDKHSIQAIRHFNELKQRVLPQPPANVIVNLTGRAEELASKYKHARTTPSDEDSE